MKAAFQSLANTFVTSTFSEFAQTFVIQQLSSRSDGQGGYIANIPDGSGGYTDWTTFASVTGFVFPAHGGESIKDGRIKSNYTHKFAFEYVDGITNAMRVFHNGEAYNILSVKTLVDQDIWTEVLAEKAVAT